MVFWGTSNLTGMWSHISVDELTSQQCLAVMHCVLYSYPCPALENPADFLIDLVNTDSKNISEEQAVSVDKVELAADGSAGGRFVHAAVA